MTTTTMSRGGTTTFSRAGSPGNLRHFDNLHRRPTALTPSTSDNEDNSCASSTHSYHTSAKMPGISDVVKGTKRLSQTIGRSFRKDRFKRRPKIGPANYTMTCKIESPPAVFQGPPEESTGAIVSGQLFLEVNCESIEFESLIGYVELHTTHRQPFQKKCYECANQFREVFEWAFFTKQTKLARGKHSYPFSFFLRGDMPASMQTPLTSIDYELTFEALPIRAPAPNSSLLETVDLCVNHQVIIDVRRAIHEPPEPKVSSRLFPPTNIVAKTEFTNIIRPLSTNNFSLELGGLIQDNNDGKHIIVWKLRRLNWILQEVVRATSPPCPTHRHLAAPASEEGMPQGDRRSAVRDLGGDMTKQGFKSDYGPNSGTAWAEFEYKINNLNPDGRNLKTASDSHSRPGSEVSHLLKLELVVGKEMAPKGRPELSAPTGTGRHLTMHFAIQMTDYPGMGISWDEEVPPLYEDVPQSPPCYNRPAGVSEDLEAFEPLEARRSSVEPLDLTIQRTRE